MLGEIAKAKLDLAKDIENLIYSKELKADILGLDCYRIVRRWLLMEGDVVNEIKHYPTHDLMELYSRLMSCPDLGEQTPLNTNPILVVYPNYDKCIDRLKSSDCRKEDVISAIIFLRSFADYEDLETIDVLDNMLFVATGSHKEVIAYLYHFDIGTLKDACESIIKLLK